MLHASFSKFDGFRDPKNRYWRLENLPKSSPKRFKSPPKNHFEALLLQRTPSNLFFFEKYGFLTSFWTPKWEQNPNKTLKNQCWKTACFWRRFFMEISPFWPPKMDPKSKILRTIIENADFAKTIVFPRRNCYFSGSEAQKNKQKSMQKRIAK